MNQVTTTQAIKFDLQNMSPEFKKVLPPHIEIERFMRVVFTCLSNTPALANLNRQSLLAACMAAAQDGLLPDSKESVILPFGDKAVYIPMVGGILKKIRNSGQLQTITAQEIYKNDVFKYWTDTDGEHLNHEPQIFSEDRGPIIGVYALAKTKDGGVYIEVMTMAQVMAVKNSTRSKGKGGPWEGAFASEMFKKTAIRRLAKRLPLSTDREDSPDYKAYKTIHADDELFEIEEEKKEVIEVPKSKTKPSRLGQLVDDVSEPTTTEENPV